MKCPICKLPDVSAGHILGHGTSKAKAESSAANGKLGGRPKSKHRKTQQAKGAK